MSGEATGTEVAAESAVGTPAEEPSAEEFDPVGTLALITLYFAILVTMWLVMYFVEFAGRGPTIVG